MQQVYAAVTDQILINLAHYFPYIKDDDGAQGSFDYQARMLAQMGQVNKETADIIAGKLGGADQVLRDALEGAIKEALKSEEPALQAAAEKGLLAGGYSAPPVTAPNMMKAFQTYYKQSADKLNLVNTVMLESTEEAYRATVSDITNKLANTQRILNVKTGEVVSGVTSYNAAIRSGVKKMVENGLTGFIDHGGHRWTPESYVEMDVKTTLFNTAREAVWERNSEYGNDLYQVSSHNGARPLCYPWQGKVLSTSGRTGTTTDLDGNEIQIHAESEVESFRYGGGLFGVNCGHHPMVFIPGVSTIKGEPSEDAEENARDYAESQQQRALERKLREEKRDLEILKAQGAPDEEIKAQRAKVRQASSEIDAFCDETGRHRQRRNEYTPVNASWDGAKVPPYGVPVENVTYVYKAKAKPTTKEMAFEVGYKHKAHDAEIDTAEQLLSVYGGEILLRKENGGEGVYTPDYLWNGKDWEQKTISTVKASEKAVRHGLKQIANNPGGLVITKGNAEIDTAQLVATIAKRINQGAVKKLDVIIMESGKEPRVYRMKGK